jgi:hypothetical protein
LESFNTYWSPSFSVQSVRVKEKEMAQKLELPEK